MRTEQQIKRKMNELKMQKSQMATGEPSEAQQAQIERLEDSILLLEWVLNEPSGKYHA